MPGELELILLGNGHLIRIIVNTTSSLLGDLTLLACAGFYYIIIIRTDWHARTVHDGEAKKPHTKKRRLSRSQVLFPCRLARLEMEGLN